MKHRKLFPGLVTNESLVCPDLCNSDCPYNCYPYMPPPIPQLLPHPPPPLQITHRNLSPYIIIASTFLGITLLLVIYYIIFIRNCFRANNNDQDDSDTDSSNEIRLPTIDHPIWYIRTVGLQPSIINSITVFNFKKGDKLIEGTDCSICLNEFHEGELLRLLPKCNHAFHIPCIDTWLRSHTNCPVCRAVIVGSLAPNTFPSTAQNSVLPMQIAETSQPGVSNNNETQEIIDIQPHSPPAEIQDFDVNEEKLVKRCISADSFPISMSKLEMEKENFHGNSGYQESPFQRSEICSTSKIHQRINDAITMPPSSYRDVRVKRSFSYGGRSFLSRHPQNSNLVLPL